MREDPFQYWTVPDEMSERPFQYLASAGQMLERPFQYFAFGMSDTGAAIPASTNLEAEYRSAHSTIDVANVNYWSGHSIIDVLRVR